MKKTKIVIAVVVAAVITVSSCELASSGASLLNNGSWKEFQVTFSTGHYARGHALDVGLWEYKGKYGIHVYFTRDLKEWKSQLDGKIAYTAEPSSNPFKTQFIWIDENLVAEVSQG